jgi:hypothetical protein
MVRRAGIGLNLQNCQFQKYGFLLNCSLVPVLWQFSQNSAACLSAGKSTLVKSMTSSDPHLGQ